MKIRTKIFLLCMGVYVGSAAITSIVGIESLSAAELVRAKDDFLKDAERIVLLTRAYSGSFRTPAPGDADAEDGSTSKGRRSLELASYSNSAVNLADRNTFLVIRTPERVLSSPGYRGSPAVPEEGIRTALGGKRNFLLCREHGNRYVIVNDRLDPETPVSMIRNITWLDARRREGYMVFLCVSIAMAAFLAAAVPLLSERITGPIERLSAAAGLITEGDFGKRANVGGKDEIAALASRFDIMAGTVERTITELRDAGERREMFTAGLVHELRTPLTSIIGYAEYLRSIRYDEKAFAKSLDHIRSEGKRMLELSTNLMELILLGRKEVRAEEVRTMRLFEEVLSVMRFKAGEKGVMLEAAGVDRGVRADRNLILELLINLADNALNATAKGGRVVLLAEAGGVETGGEKTLIRVSDTGAGIPSSELGKIFEPFYKADSSRERKNGGAGLGLSICREIARLHGTDLVVESTMGVGTTVSVLL